MLKSTSGRTEKSFFAPSISNLETRNCASPKKALRHSFKLKGEMYLPGQTVGRHHRSRRRGRSKAIDPLLDQFKSVRVAPALPAQISMYLCSG